MSYEQHNFQSGQRLYAAQLNEMDAQIAVLDKISEECDKTKIDINPATGIGYFVGSSGAITAGGCLNTNADSGRGFRYVKVNPLTEYTVSVDTVQGYSVKSSGLYIAQFETESKAGFIERNVIPDTVAHTFTTNASTQYLFVCCYLSPEITDETHDSAGNKIHIYATIEDSGITAVDSIARANIERITAEYGEVKADVNPSTGYGYFVGGTGSITEGNCLNTNSDNGHGFAYVKVNPLTEYTVSVETSQGYSVNSGGLYIAQYNTPSKAGFIDRINERGVSELTFTTYPETQYIFVCCYMEPSITTETAGNKIHIYTITEKSKLTAVDNVARDLIKSIDPLSNAVPEYFKTHIDSKCDDIIQNMRSVGREGVTFAFVTDVHWDNNAKHSPALIRYIADKTGVNVLVNGGDNIANGNLDAMIEQEKEVTDEFASAIGGDYLMVMGNHDSNRNGHASDNSYWLTYQEIYATQFYATPNSAVFRGQAYPVKTSSQPVHDYYYDIPKLKIRFVSIDSMGIANIYGASTTWLNGLLSQDDGYKYIISCHAMYSVSDGVIKPIFDSCIDDLYSNINPYASKILCVLTGHSHIDGTFMLNSSTSTDGTIPVIMTDTDGYRNLASTNPNTATLGTVTEQCFDVITVSTVDGSVKCVRIGRGANRQITHG